ncbi:MAG: DUF4091 domain-containing protein [Gemmatimonadota bacterium]|nr:DUF4091 domain-containing protein [Gemmatimonadota bacterium]
MTRFSVLIILSLAVILIGCARECEIKQGNFEAWVAPIEVRTYRGAFTREPGKREIALAGLAGEVVSAQVVVRSDMEIKGLKAKLIGPDGREVPESMARARFAGFVPVDETMTLTADPLLEADSVDVPANLAQPVWLTIHLPPDLEAGSYTGSLELSASSGLKADFKVTVEVLPATLPEPPEWSFYLNIWQDPSGVAMAHNVEPWSEDHWRLLEQYADNFAAHGMKSIMTSIVYDPWRSQSGYAFDTMVEWKYPGEFKAGGAGRFEWDFTVFDRYVEMMMAAGVREKIDLYALVMGPGGTLDANIRYLDTAVDRFHTVEMKIGEPIWHELWTAFLPALREHLKEKGWFDKALLGFDEKPEKIMKLIFDFIVAEAPDFKVASSGGYPGDSRKMGDEIVFIIDDLLDKNRWAEIEPIVRRMHEDRDKYITWYTCCWPHFPNTFIYSPLRESRLIGWLTWKYGFDGYTRWAVNAYPKDVWNQPRHQWHSGDMFFIWPGENGPLDSMRWELVRQGIQDYETLRIAWRMAEKAGRNDLLDKLREAVAAATIIDSCSRIPYIEKARAVVNQVIRELG